jgi:ATP-dependent RNA helicase DeaD
MPREEIIKRFVLGEFKPFLEYYKNAPEVNVDVGHGHPDERSGRRERPESIREPFQGPVTSLRVNIGRINGLTVPALIGLINRATPGPMLKLGRIRIMDRDSVFEVASGADEILLPNLNKANFNNRPVKCVRERGEFQGGGHRHHEAPTHAGPHEHFRKKKAFRHGPGSR